MQWADYSGGRPSGAALKAAGFGGVIRYIGLGNEGKQINGAEYRGLVADGVQVLLVAELGTGDAWGTETDDDFGRGANYARIALADARANGIPDSVPIACAADAHAAAFQIDDVVRYARGFESVLGKARTGFYGFQETLTAVHNAGVGSWYWRCGSAPSTAEKTWTNFWQRNAGETRRTVSGVQCDINDQYHPVNHTEEDMPLTQADASTIFWGTPFDGNANYAQYLKGNLGKIDGLTASITALTKIVVSNEANDVTNEGLAAALKGLISAELTPVVRDAVVAALGEGNGQQASETADAILAKIAARFTAPA